MLMLMFNYSNVVDLGFLVLKSTKCHIECLVLSCLAQGCPGAFQHQRQAEEAGHILPPKLHIDFKANQPMASRERGLTGISEVKDNIARITQSDGKERHASLLEAIPEVLNITIILNVAPSGNS